MNTAFWSTILQWSRLGFSAALFLIATRFLTLAEIGAFATAFAPLRIAQALLRSGIGDLAILSNGPEAQRRVFTLSIMIGVLGAVGLAALGTCLAEPVGQYLYALAPFVLVQSIGQPAEAVLRRQLRIRALAIRTTVAQGLSATLALFSLLQGAGAWSLICFVALNVSLTAGISLVLAGQRPYISSDRAAIRDLLPVFFRLSLRDLAGSATLPLLQLAIGSQFGLPAAGSFQIASRILGLLDALAISPIRFIALPRFTVISPGQRPAALLRSLRSTSAIACLIYPGAILAAPELLALAVGSDHAKTVAPLMAGFCLTGLINALAMPLTQALTAQGVVGLTLTRTVSVLLLTLTLAVPGFFLSVTAISAALAFGAFCGTLPFARTALRVLLIHPDRVLASLAPACLSGCVMAAALTFLDGSITNWPALASLTAKMVIGLLAYSSVLLLFSPARTATFRT
ncbi:oligosaccharide flippase family protein [Primorskyibacter sp. S87]|uniref:oligosaccharide flippase family protein n=1 Tax=Primorskyibacter sp. S87 TaxID=3415126 RepID=UPI003C7DE9EF